MTAQKINPTFTPGQVSAILKIPPSTLRRYSTLYKDYLSPQGQGRKRSYTDADINTLRKIKEYSRKLPSDQIGPRLQLADEPADEEPTSALSLLPEIAKQFETLHDQLNTLATENRTTAARLARLEQWLALPWWKRPFTPPPKP